MRVLIAVLAAALTSCQSASKPPEPAPPDPTEETSYKQAVDQLTVWHRDAAALRKRRRFDEASDILLKAQPVISQVLGVPKPSLSAMEAASDLDDLYGRMLFANRHYGPARLMFQKNVSRWTHWRPQTAETARRREVAEQALRDCDQAIERQ